MRIIRLASRNSIIDNFLASGTHLSDPLFEKALTTMKSMDELATPSHAGIASDDDARDYFTSGLGSTDPDWRDIVAYIVGINNSYASLPIVRALFVKWQHLIGHVATAVAAMKLTGIPTAVDMTSTVMQSQLTIIYSVSGKFAFGTQAQQYPMFRDLFAKFKTQIANAANNVGNIALKNAVNANGLLDYRKIYQATGGKLGKPQPQATKIAQQLVHGILRGRFDISKYTEQNFQMIKEQLMSSLGVLGSDSLEQEDEVQRKREEERLNRMDPSKLDPLRTPTGPEPSLEETHKFNDTDEQWVHPYFLTAICMLFSLYYEELSKLPIS